MVSSGAIAEGMKRLGWRPRADRQCTSCRPPPPSARWAWSQMYETKLRENGMGSAQVLLTHADLADRERYLNARSTLLTLLRLGVVPVINENDTVVNDEIKFGDNDTLGALVANLVEADALVILTDQKGLYTADPRKDPTAHFVHEARAGDPALEAMAGGAGSSIGKGGMITKILAAKRAAGSAPRPSSPGAASPMRCCGWRGARPSAPCWWRRRRRLAGAQAMDGRPPADARRGRRWTPAPCARCATKAKACCRSAWSVSGRVLARRRDRRARRARRTRLARGLANYSSAEARLTLPQAVVANSSTCWATPPSPRWSTATTWC